MKLLAENPYLPQIQDSGLSEQEHLERRRFEQIKQMREDSYPLLNDQGFVKLVDVFGTDDRIVEAARLTAQSEGKTFQGDRTLLRYLIRNRHSTPVEFCEVTFHIRIPMDAWRQFVRHRTASTNEYSTRYSPAIDERAVTPSDAWRLQSQENRQGSSDAVVTEWPKDENGVPHAIADGISPGEYLSLREVKFHEDAGKLYQERLDFGVAKEVARKDLPLSTFTEVFWKMDLHNLLHFLSLRMDSHAQKEIRDYATAIGEHFIARLFPVTWEAFQDYRMQAMQLTRLDIGVVQRLPHCGTQRGEHAPPYSEDVFMRAQDESWVELTRCRERDECREKLRRLCLVLSPSIGSPKEKVS